MTTRTHRFMTAMLGIVLIVVWIVSAVMFAASGGEFGVLSGGSLIGGVTVGVLIAIQGWLYRRGLR